MSPPDPPADKSSSGPAPGPGPESTPPDEPLDELLVDDDDFEYEVEEVDPEARAPVVEMARQEMETAAARLDVNEFYADYERGAQLDQLVQDFRLRFQIKHVMLFTAGLAVVLSLWKIANFAGLMLVALTLLGGAHAYLAVRERKRQEELEARRDRLVEALRRKQAGEEVDDEEELEEAVSEMYDAPEDAAFKLQFSVKQVMVAMTAACLLLGAMSLLSYLGLASGTAVAAVLGVLALAGLAVHATGYEPPVVVTLGWWFVMGLYVLVSVAGFFTGG